MLSAFAVRKAAQAARHERVDSALESTPVSPSISPIPKLPAKRKPTTLTTKPRKNKREKQVGVRKARYFEERDVFEQQENLIVIDSDDDNKSEGDPMTTSPTPSTSPNDSSEDEDIYVNDSGATSRSVLESPDILSTFQPVLAQNIFYLTSNQVTDLCLSFPEDGPATVVVLRPGETLCLLGIYTFCVLQGSITIAGVTLPSLRKRYRVFAPRSSPLPVLQSASGGGSLLDPKTSPQDFQPLIQSQVTVILLQELQTGVECLGRVCRIFDSVFEPSRWQDEFQFPGAQMVTHQAKDIQAFYLHHSWSSPLSSVSTESLVGAHLIKGPKKSGKSTFARYLVNQLLTRYRRVAYLECDLGQSEFTPGGMVALNVIQDFLFGPPFTHPTLPNFAHYIGATTPRSSPSHYLTAIQSLLEVYRLEMQNSFSPDNYAGDDTRISDTIPLVVNTMGWVKGLGADLTQKIQEIVEPTDIYEIESPPPDAGWRPLLVSQDCLQTFGHNAKLHILKPIPASMLPAKYSPADHRSLMILSYFHSIFPNTAPGELDQLTAQQWNTALPLCAHPPYEVDHTRTFDKVILTGAGTEDVAPSEIERVLNGAIAGLVSCEPGVPGFSGIPAAQSATPSTAAVSYTQGSSVPSPLTSTCHGLVLVRSISTTSPHMHILTPLPPELLSRSRVLVKGEMELPVWGMLDFRSDDEVAGIEKSKVPFLQWRKGEGVGGERRRVRRNLMRKAQM